MSNLLLTNEYAKYTNRGKSDLTTASTRTDDRSAEKGLNRSYIKEYSMGYGEVWSLAIPDVKGGAARSLGNFEDKFGKVDPDFKQAVAEAPSYWGEQASTGGAFYFGAALFMLFALGAVFVRDSMKWAFLTVGALSVMLAWKYGFVVDFFISYVPLFNKFRDTKMMLVLLQLAFPLLGLLFLNDLFNRQPDKKKLIYAMAAVIGLFLLFYIFPTVWFSFLNYTEVDQFEKQLAKYPLAAERIQLYRAGIESVRIQIFQAGVLRSVLFMALVAGCILLYSYKKITKPWFILAVGVLVLIDLWQVDKRYLNNDTNGYQWVKTKDKNRPFIAGVADMQILNQELAARPGLRQKIEQSIASQPQQPDDRTMDAETARINTAFSVLNAETGYRVLALGNPFADASTSYFHKSIGGYHGAKLKRYAELIQFRLDKEHDLIVKAIKSGNDSIIATVLKNQIPSLNMLNTKYIIYNPAAKPITNPYAAGQAWFVHEVKTVPGADAEIMALDTVNPRKTAVVDQAFAGLLPQNLTYDSLASITFKSYKPNHLVYESNAGSTQLAVFSEIYYKDGWNAYIDGKLTPHFRADYVLRAMAVPQGRHTIEFKFEPATWQLGNRLSMAGSVMILVFALGIVFYEIRRKGFLMLLKRQK
jgi:hypothetical protein